MVSPPQHQPYFRIRPLWDSFILLQLSSDVLKGNRYIIHYDYPSPTYRLLQNLCLMRHFAFPPWSWTGNIFIPAIISLSRLGWSVQTFFLQDFLTLAGKKVLHRWLSIFTSTINNQVYVIQGTLGKLQDSKMHYKKCRKVIKSRAPGWNWIHTSTGKAKWGRSREASCSPQLRAWPHLGRGSIHANYAEMPSGARQGP